MTTNVGKVCSVCGALIITVIVNGLPVETCQRDSLSLCPQPRIELSDTDTHAPESALIVSVSTELRPGPMQLVGLSGSMGVAMITGHRAS
jgi:hypothetical protein